MAVTSDTSKIASTKDALIAALLARVNLHDVQIIDGPIAGEPQPEFIRVGDARDWRQEWKTINVTGRPKEEEFRLEVHIRVLRGSLQIATARTRAFVLFEELEDLLRNDPEVTSNVWVASVSDGSYEEKDNGQNSEALIRANVFCRVRI